MTNSKHIPKRRFKEFVSEDRWEKGKFLDNISQIVDFRGRTPKKLGMDWSKEGYLALSALNVKNGYIDRTVESHFGDEELYNKWMSGKDLHKNQVIFTTEAPMGNVAQIPDENKYILSQRTIAFKVEDSKITDDFLAVLLKSKNTFDSLLSLTSGGTTKGVSQKSLEELSVFIPKDLKEQSFIALYLKKFDSLITLHQHKLDKLKNLKKSYLAELFPAEGERVPKRRFPGFEGEWEEKKLNEVIKDFIVPMRDKPKEFSGNIPWTRIEDIEGKYISKSHIGYCVSSETIKRMNLKIIPEGSLIVSASATFGVVAIVKNDLITNQTFIGLVPQNGYEIEFLYYLFQSPKIRAYMKEESAGSTIFYISRESFENMDIELPNEQERKLIIKQLNTLDSLLSLQQQKLDKLKNLKKAYLNELFV